MEAAATTRREPLALLATFGARLAAIAGAALAIRLIYVTSLVGRPLFLSDSEYYHFLANLLARGYGYIDPYSVFGGAEHATAQHAPVYPYLLALVSKLGGTDYVAHRAVGAVAGAGTVTLIGLLGRRLGGERVGLLAAAVAACYPLLVAADGSLMSESIYALAIVTVLLVALVLRDRPGAWCGFGLGAAVGVTTLIREEALLLLPLLALPLAWRPGSAGRWGRVALTATGCVLVVAPWTVRNWTTFDRPVLVSTNDAWVLDGANCDRTWRGNDIGGWRFDCLEKASSQNEAVAAAHRRSDALRYVRDHAGRAPLVMLVRVLRTWDFWRPLARASPEARLERRNVTFERAGVTMYFVLLALAIVGVRVLQRRHGPLLVLLAPALVVSIASAAGYGVTRFRVAAEPTIVLLAALGTVHLWDRRRLRRRPPDPASAAWAPR